MNALELVVPLVGGLSIFFLGAKNLTLPLADFIEDMCVPTAVSLAIRTGFWAILFEPAFTWIDAATYNAGVIDYMFFIGSIFIRGDGVYPLILIAVGAGVSTARRERYY